MQNEERQYFGMNGRITTAKDGKKRDEFIINNIIDTTESREFQDPIQEAKSDSSNSVNSSLDSIRGLMYNKLKKNNPIKEQQKTEE